MTTPGTAARATHTVMVLPLYAVIFAGVHFAEWVVVHGYPPLMSGALQFVVLGALAWVAGLFLRRYLRRAHAQALASPHKLPVAVPAQLAPSARDWLVSALVGGVLSVAVPTGAMSVSLTRMPISVVITAAVAAQCWRRVLAARLPTWWQALATACSLAALGLLARSPDVGGWRMAALLLGGGLVGRIGGALWRRALSDPRHQVMSIAWLTGGLALWLAGRQQHELWRWGSQRATLALFAPLAALLAVILVAALWKRPHTAIVYRASAVILGLVLLGGRVWLGDRLQQVTWLAIGLTMVAALVDPADPRDDGRSAPAAA